MKHLQYKRHARSLQASRNMRAAMALDAALKEAQALDAWRAAMVLDAGWRQSELPKDCGKFDPEKPEALVGLNADVLARLIRAAQIGICEENENRSQRLKEQLGSTNGGDFYYDNGAWVDERCEEKLLSKPVGPNRHCYPERQYLRAVRLNMETKYWIHRRSVMGSDTDSETEIPSHARTQRDRILEDVKVCITLNQIKVTGAMPSVDMCCAVTMPGLCCRDGVQERCSVVQEARRCCRQQREIGSLEVHGTGYRIQGERQRLACRCVVPSFDGETGAAVGHERFRTLLGRGHIAKCRQLEEKRCSAAATPHPAGRTLHFASEAAT